MIANMFTLYLNEKLKELDEELNRNIPEGFRVDVDARALDSGKIEILVHTPKGNTHHLTVPELGAALCEYYGKADPEQPTEPEERTLEDRLAAIEERLGL